MVRMLSFALTPLVLLLVTALSSAAPPGYVGPANTYHYPSGRDNVSPANRSLSNYFVPPQSYYLHPYNPEPNIAQWYSPSTRRRSAVDDLGLDVPLPPRVLREPETPTKAPAVITVRVPEGAEIWFNGEKTQRTGSVRVFKSPPLEPETNYAYDVKAHWRENGKDVERTFHVPVTAGSRSEVSFQR